MKSFSIICRADELMTCLNAVKNSKDGNEEAKEKGRIFLNIFCDKCGSRYWEAIHQHEGVLVICTKCGHKEIY